MCYGKKVGFGSQSMKIAEWMLQKVTPPLLPAETPVVRSRRPQLFLRAAAAAHQTRSEAVPLLAAPFGGPSPDFQAEFSFPALRLQSAGMPSATGKGEKTTPFPADKTSLIKM